MLDTIKYHAHALIVWAYNGSKLTYAAIAIGLVIALVLFRLFFKSVAGLFHSIGFSFGAGGNPEVAAKPGLCSSSRVKLILFSVVPVASAYAAYMVLPSLFPTIFIK
jgi:hypothetical protein